MADGTKVVSTTQPMLGEGQPCFFPLPFRPQTDFSLELVPIESLK